MKEIKTRKTYEKPTTTVVVMQHRTQLLTGSVQANRSGYGTANDGVTDELASDGSWEWK
jgi:hypothetical protein